METDEIMPFEDIVESLIKEAQERGEFDNLTGMGKPIDLTEYFNSPEDVRVAQSVLKNAGMIPREIELLKEITALKESIQEQHANNNIRSLRKVLKDKQLEFNLLIERYKRK